MAAVTVPAGTLMVRNRQSQDLYRELRKRMIRETEEHITDSLRHPERMVRIPSIKVGHGAFTARFAGAFWSQVLGLPTVVEPLWRRIICERFRR
jgi:hypothetical protein